MKKILFTAALFVVSFTTFAQVGVGTTNPDSSAALEINSTTGGLLTPRLTVTERDAIGTPANGLLIFNTSNNTFEVYKTSCSCWVSISDTGNTPASSLVNTAPTASTLNYTGTFRDGGTVNLIYTYNDAQNDAEGTTSIQWQVANDNQGNGLANLGTEVSQALSSSEAGRYVRAIVTPRAASGILNGISYNGSWTLVDSGSIPTATGVSSSGTVAQGSTLTGVYGFSGGSGTEYVNPTDANDKSVYTWESATDALGLDKATAAYPDGQDMHYGFFTPNSSHIGKFIRFGIKAKDSNGLTATSYVYGAWVGPIEVAAEAAPVAQNVTYSPSPGTNVTLTGSYTYADANNDPEATSTYKWYTADDANGLNQTPIAGATGSTFTVTSSQSGFFVGFGVTPVAQTGTSTGSESVYYNPTASITAADFTIIGFVSQSSNYHAGRTMDSSNTLTISINVTSAGSISFSSDTVDGYSFSGGGTYETTGIQNVVLTAAGSKTTYNSSGDTFDIQGVGNTTKNASITIANVGLGSDFTTHYNGIVGGVSVDHTLSTYSSGETFDNNGEASSKIISASSCPGTDGSHKSVGTISVGANSYGTININGQCWMSENLKELPNGAAITAGQWLISTPGDQGYYGYYNSSDTTGASGWGTSEVRTGDGLLYQWSAAMLGSTLERAQGVCPTGWHIPSDTEWMYLEHGLGMEISEQTGTGWRAGGANNEGTPSYKLRSEGANNTNESGFDGLIAGHRATTGSFSNQGAYGYFWTSTANGANHAYYRLLYQHNSGIFRQNTVNKAHGLSVRCLQD